MLTLVNQLAANKWVIGVYIGFYFIVTCAVSLHRFWQFEYFYYDHGLFDQSLWSVAHGMPPLIDHFVANVWSNQLGDHFTPVYYLLSPLYWITSAYEPLIVVQNIFITASAAVMWLLTRRLKLPGLLALALLIAYTWFLGIQGVVIHGFHTETPALLTLAGAFYFIEAKKYRWYLVMLLLTLGLKETMFTIGLALGIYLLFKKQWRWAVFTMVFSFIYFYSLIKVVMPAIRGDKFDYYPTPISIASLQELVSPAIKNRTTLVSLGSFGFLPLADVVSAPLWLQDFFVRYVLSRDDFAWGFGFHYAALSGILLYFGAGRGAVWLLHKKWYGKIYWLHAGLIIIFVCLAHYKLRGPLGLFFNPAFYKHTPQMQFLRNFIAQIPHDGLTMTQNNLAPYMTHTNQVMLLRDRYWEHQPQTIALDIRSGQNPNNYWPIDNKMLYDRLIQDPNYEIHKISPDQVFFSRKANFDENFYVKNGWAVK